jgi:hypothetical protein
MLLVPFPDRDNPTMWVNPEHITSLVPTITTPPAPIMVTVRCKLQGLSEFVIHLGQFNSPAAAEQRWRGLLELLGNAVLDIPRDSL